MKTSIDIDVKIRPFRGLDEDVPAIAEIFNGELKADGVPGYESAAGIRAWMAHPTTTFDPARDVDLAEVDGQAVAYTEREWVDTNDGLYREYRINGAVLPEWRRQGIGNALYDRNVERARELAATHETGRQKVLGSWSNDR